jgi:hypothetical protein
MPDDAPSTPTVDGSRAPPASQDTTVTHVPAEYIVEMVADPDRSEPIHAQRYSADMIMVFGEDGKTLLHGEVHVDDPRGTTFNLEDEGYTKHMEEGYLFRTNASEEGSRLLVWPATDKISGGKRQGPEGQDGDTSVEGSAETVRAE